MKKIFLPLALILLLTIRLNSQQVYLAGTGVESIEPPDSLISLHLGGYGAPKEGRFTLQWTRKGLAPAAESFTGAGDRFFILSQGQLLCHGKELEKGSWLPAAAAENITAIAGAEGRLYGITGEGVLMVSSADGKIRWKKAAELRIKAELMAATGNRIFVTDGNGTLVSYSLPEGTGYNTKSSMPRGIISLTAREGWLYALAANGDMFRSKLPDGQWLKAAYRNNETIREDIRKIAFMEGRIYGIDNNGILYEGEHRSEGNLTARALALREGKNTVVIMNVDVCGMTADITGQLKKELSSRHGLAPENIFINFSHTHFAPVSQNWLTWQEANQRPDSIYLNVILRNGILKAVDKAVSDLSPAELWFGRGKTDIGYNRSLKEHPELYDSDVDVIKIVHSDSDEVNYLFMAGCHPVFSTAGTLHYTISANYPGVARQLVEERTKSSTSLFLQGTAGDINPRDNGEYISGEKLAAEVIATTGKPMTRISGPVTCFLDTISLPVRPWSREQIIAYRADNEGKTGDVYAEKNVKWADLMLDYYNKGTMPGDLPVYVQTLNIGNWKLVGFSRETTTGYSFGVKQMWPGQLVSVTGYTNDVSSYLPTHMHLEARNYEGLDSFFWYGMVNVFPSDVDEVILSRIKALAR